MVPLDPRSPGRRFSLAGAMLALVALASCGQRNPSNGSPLNPAGLEVAGSFVQAVISGDGDEAARLRIPNVATTDLREFAEENSRNDLRIVGTPKIVENRVRYQVVGRELGVHPAHIRASFRVWMVKTEAGWRVSDWWYHIQMRTFLDEEIVPSPEAQ
ncbi:MAG: hypothetical protein ACRDIZ_08175 [Actinomycetota bacterium]